MTTLTFSAIIGTSTAFNAASDFLSLTGDAADFSFVESGSNLVVNNSGGQSATLTGASLEQLTTTNVLFSGSSSNLIAGDNSTATTDDNLAQAASGVLDLVVAAGANLDADNRLFGLGDGDYISAGDGNNVIFGGSGAIDSTDGSDTIVIDGSGTTSGSNLIYGNAGNDTFLFTDPTGAGKATTIYGGLGADDFVSGAAAGTLLLYGNAGADTINGASATGDITVYGGNGAIDSTDGADVITTGLGNATVYGNAGDDDLNFDDFASGKTQTFYAGLGNDTLEGDVGGAGSSGSLVLYANGGTDTINVSTHLGSATVYGGNGAVDSTDGADTITIGAGNAAHNVTIYGNAGDDSITSSAALAAGETILLYAGLGADTISISGARSATSSLTLNGNGGNDIFNIDDSTLAADATVTIGGFESTDKINITLSGGDATDLTVTGLGAAVTITNGAGDGNYVFNDYTGNFTSTNFVLSDGSVLLTNAGATVASMSGTANNDQIIAGTGGDTISGLAGNDKITGGDGADSISGGDDDDSISGGEGNDTIDGGDGANTINGGNSADAITGGVDADSILGGNGNDTLEGDTGADTLTGGNENDTFAYAVATVDATDTNVDLITDAFTGNDKFDFTDLTNANLRGTGVTFASGNASGGQALGANVGLYVATNAAADFTEANIYTALSGIADDLANGDKLYVLISNGTDSRLVLITEAANAGGLVAVDDTLEFVARLSGVSNTELADLVAGNFVDFS